jgi:NitT/TauT family transport system substrate-binding protein
MYLAQAQGYFEQEGVKVEITKTEQIQLPQLLAGQVEVAWTPVSTGFYNAAARNVGLKIIAPGARQDPDASGLFLNIRKDLVDTGKVKDYADLKGLKLAVPNDQMKYNVAKAMEAGGRQLADVELVTLNFESMVTSFGNGSIDAGFMPEPLASASAKKGLSAKWKAVGQFAPGEQQTVIVASPQFAASKELAVKWVTGYLRGIRDYNDAFFKNQRRQQVVDILAKALPVADPSLYDKMAYTALDPAGKVNIASLDDQMRWFVQAGMLAGPVDVSSLVDPSLAEQAVAKLGPYR